MEIITPPHSDVADANSNGGDPIPAIPLSNPSNTLPKAYKRLLKTNFFATIIVVAIPGVWLLAIFFINASKPDSKQLPIPFLLLVAMLGALGAFFSTLTRLSPSKNLSADSLFSFSEEVNNFDNFTFLIYALLRPLTGFIAAIILYLAIMSGLVGGDLFPKFVCDLDHPPWVEGRGCTTLDTIFKLGPDIAQDYIKALVWGFISGFSERFLPNILEGLEKKADNVGG